MSKKDLPIFRKDRIRTGIHPLDIMLEGGYKFPATVMLMGPTGSEKQAFAAHFVNEGLSEGDVVIYITTDKSPKEIEKAAAAWDLHFKGPGQLFFIDCYTQAGAEKTKGSPNIFKVGGPGAINEISLYVSEILRGHEGKRFRVVFHTLSTFALYNEKSSLFKFVQSIESRVKGANGTVLVLVEEGMHEDSFISSLRHSIDEEFTLGAKEKKKELSGGTLPIAIPLKVGALGVEVE